MPLFFISAYRKFWMIHSLLLVMQEFNSVEAIKSAVRFNLGVAFVSASSIEKELELGLVARVSIRGVRLLRSESPLLPAKLAVLCFVIIVLYSAVLWTKRHCSILLCSYTALIRKEFIAVQF
jgi:DNA-binding transcriptional LysR family regulator